MSILICGGAGYLGGAVTDCLGSEDFTVYDSLLFEDQYMKRVPQFINGDVRDTGKLFKAAEKADTIIWLAARVGDGACAIDPKTTTEVNYQAAADFVKRLPNKRFIFTSTCYDNLTAIVTDHGIKDFDSLDTTSDKVLTYNIEKNIPEWKAIEKKISFDYNGEMVEIKGRRVNQMVTPDHKVLISSDCKHVTYTNANDLIERSYISLPIYGRWLGESPSTIMLDDHIQDSSDIEYNDNFTKEIDASDMLYIIGLFVGDGYISHSSYKAANKTGLSRADFLSMSRDGHGKFSRVGHIGQNNFIRCNSWQTSFAIPTSDNCRIKIENILCKNKINYYTFKPPYNFIAVTSKRLYKFMEQFGHGAKNKFIPRWVLDLDSSLLLPLLQGLMDSDGSSKEGNVIGSYSTTSKELLGNIVELCYKLGLTVSYKFSKPDKPVMIEGRLINSSGSWNICIARSHRTLTRKNVTRVPYSGRVWCLQVEDNHNFLITRNGKADFSGNCSVYGASPNDILTEESTTGPLSLYAQTKLDAEKAIQEHCRAFFVLRLGTLYGLGDMFSRIRLDLCLNAMTVQGIVKGKLRVFGGEQYRPLLHVYDVAAFIAKLARTDRFDKLSGIYNLALENYKIADLAKLIAVRTGASVQYTDIKFEDARNYRVSSDKARSNLLFNPLISLCDGIDEIAELVEEGRIHDIDSPRHSNAAFLGKQQ